MNELDARWVINVCIYRCMDVLLRLGEFLFKSGNQRKVCEEHALPFTSSLIWLYAAESMLCEGGIPFPTPTF